MPAVANGPWKADLPRKHQRAAELAARDVTLRRWEYFFNPYPPFVWRWIQGKLSDPRDMQLVLTLTNVAMVMWPLIAIQWCLEPGTQRAHLVGLAYLVSMTALFDARFILCLHYGTHLKLFDPAKAGRLPALILNELAPTIFAPFFGIPPGLYFAHHVVMHHVEDNVWPGDLSSTMPYQRDSFIDFLKYWANYLLVTGFYLPYYCLRTGRRRLALYSAGGFTAYLCATGAMWAAHPTATLWTVVLPLFKASLTLMFGNFSQHIFVDPSDPYNDYRSTYTCVNVLDNRFTFNDGYHVAHHLHARRHWADMPGSFVEALGTYEENDALVFDNLFFLEVGVLVMTGQWNKLARHVVPLSDNPRTEEETVAWLKSRVQRIPGRRPDRATRAKRA